MPGPIKIKIKGDKEMLAALNKIAREFPKKVAASVHKQSEKIMIKSKRDFVPVDIGTLKGTGMVEEPKISGGKISVTLAYGGPAAPYADEQHENMEYAHTHGGSKYLERPLKEAVPKLANEIAKDLKL